MSDVTASKFLSLILRHKPEAAGISLDPEGWAEVEDILAAKGPIRDRAHLEHVVRTSDKKRFVLSVDGRLIRAAQGHSVEIDLGLTPIIPPEILYHGTASRFLEAILGEGLKPGGRQYVHLSSNAETARTVGARHGRPVVLLIDTAGARAAGQVFYLAENGVWLSDRMSPEFLKLLD